MNTKNIEMLENEKVAPLLIKLSAPAMVGMFLISLYNVVDAFFVGRGVGALGIAAVFISFPTILTIMAVAQTFGVGGASLTSRFLGAKNNEQAEEVLGSVLSVGFITGLFMGLFFYVTTNKMIVFFGASPEILAPASLYAKILFAGTPFFNIMMIMNNLVRGEGNTKLSMWSMAISSLSNVVMDALFIFVFGWGIAGAAIATVLSQILAVVWLLNYYVSGKSAIKLRSRYFFHPSLHHITNILKVGASAFIRQTGIAISWTILNKVFSATGGDIAVASSGIIQRLFSIIVMPMIGMGHGLLPIVGYNYGAKAHKRILEVMNFSNGFSTVFCFVASLILFIFPAELLSFFSESNELLQIGIPGAKIVSLGIVTTGVQICIATYYQGIGNGGLSFFLSMLRPLLLQPVIAIVLTPFYGILGAWLSFPISDFGTFLISVVLYHYSVKKIKETL
ncbi:MAG: MATE family efflux transporter [Synergistaceae bacterium]